jgi:hypothetical protein
MENLYDSKKFWIIWYSCLESSRTVKEIHEIWDYSDGSKALYQPAGTGHEKAIAEEMVDEGFLEVESKRKTRGATAKVLSSNTEWYTDYIKEEALDTLEEENREILEDNWNHFENALKNDVFRGTAFEMEAFKQILPSKMSIKSNDDRFPFLIYVYFIFLSVAHNYIEEEMQVPMPTKTVFTNGLLGLDSLTNSTTDSSVDMTKYLEKLIENHGLESAVDCVPEETVESEFYTQLEDQFAEQMQEVQDMLGGMFGG